jgi:hypothetical protein
MIVAFRSAKGPCFRRAKAHNRRHGDRQIDEGRNRPTKRLSGEIWVKSRIFGAETVRRCALE